MWWGTLPMIFYFIKCVYGALNSPSYSSNQTIIDIKSTMGTIKHSLTNTNTTLKINCNKHDNQNIRMTDVFPPSKAPLSFTEISINQCLPNTSYVEEFKTLNINTYLIDTLTLKFHLDKPITPGNYTEGLTIKDLSIVNDNYPYILQNNPNFFEPLSKLMSMYVSGIEIPPLPETMRLVNLTLSNGATLTDWGNCGYLERFELARYNGKEFPVWPRNCTRLEHLEVGHLSPETALIVAERLIAATPSLRTLKITHCRLNNLPIEIIRAAKNLLYLDLSENKLYDQLFRLFPSHDTLRILNLTGNPIRGKRDLGTLVPKLPAIVELIMRNMEDSYYVCYGEMDSIKTNLMAPLQNSSIESIDFGETYTYVDCVEEFRFTKLKRLTMLQAASAQITLLKLPQTEAEHLTVDFGTSHFIDIYFNKSDYETLQRENSTSPHNGRNLTILTGHVDCNCKHGWLARALRDFPHIISMPNTRCNHEYGNHILDEPKELLECNMTGRDWCFYRQSWRDGTVIGECDKKAWITMAPLFPLHGLNVSGKGISTLHATLPDTIKWLDLRHNRISHASAEEAAALFAAGRRVWLADNLLLCDCDNRALLDAIQQHRTQVEDYELLRCVGTGEVLSSISTDALCQVALVASLSVAGVLVVVAGIIALLLRRYGEQLRMFLYSKGWCLSCLQKLEPDDKPYDAFISFAHEDREYVMETLLPGLENAPEKFRVCVHYRDWLVGDWIPAQIMRSVQLSKRTLILMSKNFIGSAWSTLEFRYSIANADEDVNAKVLVLIKDDVLDMDFSTELRSYLTYNTYLRCDDPWFWQKLRYAMPHRVQTESSRSENIDMGKKITDMKMGNVNLAIDFPCSTDMDNVRK